MGTDAAVSGREPLFTRTYVADGSETTNGIIRVRAELLKALRDEGLLEINGTYSCPECGHGARVFYRLKVDKTKKRYEAEAPACLGEVTMHVYEV